MAKVNVSIPQGTRDFGPQVVRKRNFIFSTIKKVFELYGFQPLETPAMENLDTLMGKYGEEGDKLIFKILNNGLDHPQKQQATREAFEKILEGKNSKEITERALRYDLTIPFARYVAINHGQLTFPFKRYQIQPVWRADRPQKGRYREFYQCDADVVGSYSLLNEAELANIYATVFSELKIPVEIKINNRKILTALAELCGDTNKMNEIAVAIDKLDKIGIEKTKEELTQREFSAEQIARIENYLSVSGNNHQKLSALKNLFQNSTIGQQGIAELETVLSFPLLTDLVIDVTLARGLNYYTATIFEVSAKNVKMGSIGGGGRYDDLTGLFGVPNIPGVGISFGVDRIYDVMEELDVFPQTVEAGTTLLFFNLGEKESRQAFALAQQLRQKGISCEVYHEPAKFDKQFKYAERKKIAYIAIIGEEELKNQKAKIKNLASGQQTEIAFNHITEFVF
ncbi:MAG: histidine--tRNA ligase [Chitinophagaceae bacterium]